MEGGEDELLLADRILGRFAAPTATEVIAGSSTPASAAANHEFKKQRARARGRKEGRTLGFRLSFILSSFFSTTPTKRGALYHPESTMNSK